MLQDPNFPWRPWPVFETVRSCGNPIEEITYKFVNSKEIGLWKGIVNSKHPRKVVHDTVSTF
jgi:hypothetical protein